MIRNFQQTLLNPYGQQVGINIKNNADLNQLKADSVLKGENVKLIAFDSVGSIDPCVDDLWAAMQNPLNQQSWTYLPYEGFKSKDQLKAALLNQFNFSYSIHYFIQVKNKMVGWIALISIEPTHASIEIGNVYFSPVLKQSTASTALVYLLLKQCFEHGFRRVEWKCDDLNEPSRKAALRFGFSFEGIFRQHRITKGRNRNTAWFSILDDEWPDLEASYKAWLNPSNFTENGQQINPLQSFR